MGSILLLALLLVGSDEGPAWNAKSAADYLDGRAMHWSTLKASQRDHETFCISCHTALPYALARPTLRKALGETAAGPAEQKMLDSVTKRVRLWAEVEPFYKGDPKSAESRGTEAILNTLILASRDARDGKLSEDGKTALDNLWALQQPSGGWNWLNFHNAPWEADESEFYGVALGAVAIGTAPGGYSKKSELQDKVAKLQSYLRERMDKASPVNRFVLLWASAKLPGLLTAAQQKAIVNDALATQREDGGWNLATLIPTPGGTWKRQDGTPLDTSSDGYATGLVTLALKLAGTKNPRAVAWLERHQDKDGVWSATSLNKQRDPSTEASHFMTDFSTAYAVMALTQ